MPGVVDPEPNAQAYSRKKTTRTYPYRSNWQPLRACYALFGCTMMIVFNGWRSISPFSAPDFVASYISVCACPPPPPELNKYWVLYGPVYSLSANADEGRSSSLSPSVLATAGTYTASSRSSCTQR